MTDPLDRLLQPPAIEPLAAPAGHFDAMTRRARTRRHRRAAAGAAVLACAVVVSGVAAGAVLAPSETRRTPATTASPTASAAPSPSTAVSPYPSRRAAALPGTGPVPAGFRPWSITYGTATVGFVLGEAPCAHAPCTSLVVTGDNGRTWRGLPAPKAALPANRFGPSQSRAEVREVRFANARDGWIFGGALYATHDGGHHWQALSLHNSTGPLTVQQLETDGQRAYAVVANCDAVGACRNYRLYVATVGTDAWRPEAGALGSSAGLSIGSLAISGQGGIVLAGGRPWIHSGTGWQSVGRPPCGDQGRAAGATVSASDSRLVVFCGEGAAGSLYLSPWVSDDNGSTWRKVADGSARVPNGSLSVAAARSTVLLVAAASPDFGGRLLRSGDGGRTFAGAGVPERTDGWWYVGARSATSLVALPGKPDGSIWTSGDSGRTWQSCRFR